MGRKPLPAEARKRQLNVALDEGVRRHLEIAALDQGRSLTDEVRSRLQRTVQQDVYVLHYTGETIKPDLRELEDEIIKLLQRERIDGLQFDEPTRRLASDIKELARDVSFSKEAGWHQHSLVHAALVVAINTWLNAVKPLPALDDASVTEQMEQRDYDPQSIGKTIAHLHLRRREDPIATVSYKRTLEAEEALQKLNKKKGKPKK
ncbi:MAG TPA: hypothetical protein VGI22_22980 [Xanthobacteraceae bacterium]